MFNGIFFEFDASHHAMVVLFVYQFPNVIQLCVVFETRSLQQRRLWDNYNFGTAASTSDQGLKWS